MKTVPGGTIFSKEKGPVPQLRWVPPQHFLQSPFLTEPVFRELRYKKSPPTTKPVATIHGPAGHNGFDTNTMKSALSARVS